MKPLTKTSITPELIDQWAKEDQPEPTVGAGACCLSHQVKAMHQKPQTHTRLRKPLKKHILLVAEQPTNEAVAAFAEA